jgi:hypothetical protein
MRSTLTILALVFGLFLSAQIESRLLSPLPDQARDDAVGFTIDGIGYVTGGRKTDFGISNQLWAYDPSSDTWEARAQFPGNPRQYSSSFVLDNKGYVFCGLSDPSLTLDEVWRYDPNSNSWTQMSDFPGGNRYAPISFVLNGIAYAGLGKEDNNNYHDDLWRYYPDEDEWMLAAQFPKALYSAISLSIDGQELIGLGVDSEEAHSNEAWLFDGTELRYANSCFEGIGFADAMNLGEMGIVIGGRTDEVDAKDGLIITEIIYGTNGFEKISWQSQEGMVDGPKRNGTGFQIGDKGYYFGGKDVDQVKSNALLEFTRKRPAQEIRIEPNPVAGEVSVSSSSGFNQVVMYNSYGQMVLKEDLGRTQHTIKLDLQSLSSGVYLLSLDGESSTRMMVVR